MLLQQLKYARLLHQKFWRILQGVPSWSKRFPRLYDLYAGSDRCHPSNYFSDPKVKQALEGADSTLIEIEDRLQQLDENAWKKFQAKAVRYVTATNQWGWNEQLFDCLNEPKGYVYLKDQGYSDIRFIPEVPDKKTPDLCGTRYDGHALVEVKTVHESDDVNCYRTRSGKYQGQQKEARDVTPNHNQALENKLKSHIQKALEQLQYNQEAANRRIVFLVITLDSSSPKQSEKNQLEKFLRANCPCNIEIESRIENNSSPFG